MIPAEMKFYKDDFCKSKKKKKILPLTKKDKKSQKKQTFCHICKKKKFDKELHENQKNEKVGITVIRQGHTDPPPMGFLI